MWLNKKKKLAAKFNSPFFNNLPLLMAKKDIILSDNSYYMIQINGLMFFAHAFSVSGVVRSLPLGALLEIWTNIPSTTRKCKCGGTAVIVHTIGSAMTGICYCTSICLKCNKIKYGKAEGTTSTITNHFFTAKNKFEGIIDNKTINLDELIEILKKNSNL